VAGLKKDDDYKQYFPAKRGHLYFAGKRTFLLCSDSGIEECVLQYTYGGVYMRTNIVLDETLMKEAFKYTTVSTKRELVDLTLREFVTNHRQHKIQALRNSGKKLIRDDYDYKALRNEDGK
jgi:Arc/MetJ family transcription regulator